MLLRIVRMEFQEEKVLEFQKLFKNIKGKISDFKGCESIHLYRDKINSMFSIRTAIGYR